MRCSSSLPCDWYWYDGPDTPAGGSPINVSTLCPTCHSAHTDFDSGSGWLELSGGGGVAFVDSGSGDVTFDNYESTGEIYQIICECK